MFRISDILLTNFFPCLSKSYVESLNLQNSERCFLSPEYGPCVCVSHLSANHKVSSSAAGPHSTNAWTRSIHTPHCRYLERSPPAFRHCASCCASLRDARRHMPWCPRCHFNTVRKCVICWFMHQVRDYVVTVSESLGSGSVMLTDFRSVQRRIGAFRSFWILKE